jgi:K+/H+ antiporter YhaU regulatory subunit KhtT
MRKLKVRRHRLAGIGERLELDTAAGCTVTVVNHRSGKRDLAVTDPGGDAPRLTIGLTRTEATALAFLLTGVHVELDTVEG